MPRSTKIAKTSRRDQVSEWLKLVDQDPENCFTANMDLTLKEDSISVIYLRFRGSWCRDVGIEPNDIIVLDISKTETPEHNGIICSVVCDIRDDNEFMEFNFEEHHGSDDILDVEYLYPDEAEGTKRRKKKSDSPQITRHVIGVVTHIVRDAENLRERL